MDPVTAEKRTAMFRNRLLQRMTTLFRFLEALILTLLVVWCSARIPAAAKASVELLCHVIPVLIGPRFLFLLANAIVLSLIFFFNSRHVSTSNTNANTIDDQISSAFQLPPQQVTVRAEEEVVVFEDKNVCSVKTTTPPPRVQRTCRRSRSERMMKRRRSPDLRRSETDVGKVKGEEKEEDADAFRRTIEAFIEKQLRFQKEESMAIVCTDGGDRDLLSCSAGTVEAKGK